MNGAEGGRTLTESARRTRESQMKFVMMLAMFGAMTALFALIGLSDQPHPAYHANDQTVSFQQ
jgi:hypothetical protein